jgi:NAD(P)-dependent dehydrogenase (short-subunit alcohol dehydrogenase family)
MTMPPRKSIFITGAASGIGKATAHYFARRGWFIGLGDVNEKGLRDLQQDIGDDLACALVTDVTQQEGVQAAIDAFGALTAGRMEVLFNCAGILRMGRHQDIPIEEQTRIVAVNLDGVLHCIQAGLPLLRKTPGACVINMSSASAVYGVPELAVYSATKFAVRGLTEALDIEFEPLGVRVCDIMVPYVATPMIMDAEVQATSVHRLGVHIRPEKVAATVWCAVHGRRLHWKVGAAIRGLMFGMWALPFGRRFLVKALTFGNGKP